MAVVDLGFLAGLFAVFGDPAVYAGDLGRLRALLAVPLLGAALTGAVVVCAALSWWRGLWNLPARLHYTALALAGVAFIWFLGVPRHLEPPRLPPVSTGREPPESTDINAREEIIEIPHLEVERGMLRGIKARAEQVLEEIVPILVQQRGYLRP